MDHNVRLIACDMDGTLLGSDKVVSQANAAALREAAQAGIHLCAASGRTPGDIHRLLGDIGIAYHVLGLNGAVVQAIGEQQMLFPMTDEQVTVCIDAAQCAGIDWWVQTTQGSFGSAPLYEQNRVIRSAQELTDLGQTTIKFLGFSEDRSLLGEARAAAEEAGLSVSSSWESNFEVNAPGVNKGRALSELAAKLGVPREAVMAFGDHENDRQMLRWAGVSVAMGNAVPAVAQVARYRTKRNDQDGVAWGIRKWAL